MFNNHFFLVFLLAHLTGDFVLQTERLVRRRAQSIEGVLRHSALVCTVQIVFLSVFGMRGVIAAVLAAISHFCLDYVKLLIGSRLRRMDFLYLALDQAVHVGILAILTLLFASETDTLEQYIELIKLLIGLIILTFTATVMVKKLLQDLYPVLVENNLFKKNERILDAAAGVLIWAGCFYSMAVGMAVALAAFFIYQQFQRRVFRYDQSIVSIKFVLLAAIACTVFVWLT